MTKSIVLSRSKTAIVDDDDYEMLNQFDWHLTANGYAGTNIWKNGAKSVLLMHRFLLLPDPEQQVDHANGIGTDNRRENIRVCSRSENLCNRPCQRNSSSHYKGVHYHPQTGRWLARIGKNGKTMYLGIFKDPVDAALAYDIASITYHKDFAYRNFLT